MGSYQYDVDDPEYCSYLSKYFKVSGYIIDNNPKLEIEEPYDGYGNFHFYHDEIRGRILIFIVTQQTDFHTFLLFSPLGTLEKYSKNSTLDDHEMELVIKIIIQKNLKFRNEIIKEFCKSKEDLNISLKLLGLKFNFFSDYEEIAVLNPFCASIEDFLIMRTIISNALDTYKEKKIKTYLQEKGNRKIGSIKALELILKKLNKYSQVESEIRKLNLIRAMRNINPVHDTNQPLVDFLKEYKMIYPRNENDWCDLSVFIIKEISKLLQQITQETNTNC